ncbi:MAG: phytanoyl-CoA dioxygenase family protein [Pseudomonadota bacterium]
MSAARWLGTPLHLAAVASTAKSFRGNPVLGSPSLNRRGLHLARVRWAERMARARRRRLVHLIGADYAERFDRDGIVIVPDLLPGDELSALRSEVEETAFDAREMKQGHAVTRFITLAPGMLPQLPNLRRFVRHPLFQGLLRYAASHNRDPLVTLHTVLTNPDPDAPDPQSSFHSDTFHAAAKGWFFLRDVLLEEGPFTYVRGSHYATPGRLEWEHEASIAAAEARDPHHALGSFRATAAEIEAMGYSPPEPLPVAAGTLVVADTHGFHARWPASRPSTRLSVYGSSRHNPFLPVAGPDPMDLPGLRGRRAQLLDLKRDLAARLTGRPDGQPPVGRVRPTDPPVR